MLVEQSPTLEAWRTWSAEQASQDGSGGEASAACRPGDVLSHDAPIAATEVVTPSDGAAATEVDASQSLQPSSFPNPTEMWGRPSGTANAGGYVCSPTEPFTPIEPLIQEVGAAAAPGDAMASQALRLTSASCPSPTQMWGRPSGAEGEAGRVDAVTAVASESDAHVTVAIASEVAEAASPPSRSPAAKRLRESRGAGEDAPDTSSLVGLRRTAQAEVIMTREVSAAAKERLLGPETEASIMADEMRHSLPSPVPRESGDEGGGDDGDDGDGGDGGGDPACEDDGGRGHEAVAPPGGPAAAPPAGAPVVLCYLGLHVADARPVAGAAVWRGQPRAQALVDDASGAMPERIWRQRHPGRDPAAADAGMPPALLVAALVAGPAATAPSFDWRPRVAGSSARREYLCILRSSLPLTGAGAPGPYNAVVMEMARAAAIDVVGGDENVFQIALGLHKTTHWDAALAPPPPGSEAQRINFHVRRVTFYATFIRASFVSFLYHWGC